MHQLAGLYMVRAFTEKIFEQASIYKKYFVRGNVYEQPLLSTGIAKQY